VLALKAARARGARLTLVAPPARVRRMLAVTGLDTVFELGETFGSFGRSDRSGCSDVLYASEPPTSALAV